MGCVKSKKSDSSGARNATHASEKAYLVNSDLGPPPQVSPVLLDYAHRLSEEIVARAVQQWVEVDSRYSDIPYIECDVP